jgi:hypothetical protein
LLAAGALRAADPATGTIDLPTVLRLAGANNLDVQIAREKVTEARAASESARARFFPWIPLGGVVLPLNWDPYLALTLNHPTAGAFTGFFSTLTPDGGGAAALTLPGSLSASLVGLTAHHAYLAFDDLLAGSISFASNAVPLAFVP